MYTSSKLITLAASSTAAYSALIRLPPMKRQLSQEVQPRQAPISNGMNYRPTDGFYVATGIRVDDFPYADRTEQTVSITFMQNTTEGLTPPQTCKVILEEAAFVGNPQASFPMDCSGAPDGYLGNLVQAGPLRSRPQSGSGEVTGFRIDLAKAPLDLHQVHNLVINDIFTDSSFDDCGFPTSDDLAIGPPFKCEFNERTKTQFGGVRF